MRTPVAIGVVGLGRWGCRVVHVLAGLPQTELRWLCDRNAQTIVGLKARYRGAQFTLNPEDLWNDESLDAVVLATPVALHHELATRALGGDKHVLLKRVLSLSGDEAEDLVGRAKRSNRALIVGHSNLHHPALRKLKELMDAGDLGDAYHLTVVRTEPCEPTFDDDVLWKLGPDEVAAVLGLLGDEPIEVTARGEAYVRPEVFDVAVGYLRFATGISVALYLSSLDPRLQRTLTVVGSLGVAILDLSGGPQPLTIYGTEGDVYSPHVRPDDALRGQCEHFVHLVRSSRRSARETREAAKVVHILENLHSSLTWNLDGDLFSEDSAPAGAKVVHLRVHGPS